MRCLDWIGLNETMTEEYSSESRLVIFLDHSGPLRFVHLAISFHFISPPSIFDDCLTSSYPPPPTHNLASFRFCNSIATRLARRIRLQGEVQ